MAKVVWTERLSNYHKHILEVSRQLSPEEASVILIKVLGEAVGYISLEDSRIKGILTQDAHTLRARMIGALMVKEDKDGEAE